jgi:hypothetical protein
VQPSGTRTATKERLVEQNQKKEPIETMKTKEKEITAMKKQIPILNVTIGGLHG